MKNNLKNQLLSAFLASVMLLTGCSIGDNSKQKTTQSGEKQLESGFFMNTTDEGENYPAFSIIFVEDGRMVDHVPLREFHQKEVDGELEIPEFSFEEAIKNINNLYPNLDARLKQFNIYELLEKYVTARTENNVELANLTFSEFALNLIKVKVIDELNVNITDLNEVKIKQEENEIRISAKYYVEEEVRGIQTKTVEEVSGTVNNYDEADLIYSIIKASNGNLTIEELDNAYGILIDEFLITEITLSNNGFYTGLSTPAAIQLTYGSKYLPNRDIK